MSRNRVRLARLLQPGEPPKSAGVVIVGAGIAGLAAARALAERGVRDVVVVERGYPGSGATGRNVARIRAMQLTESLCEVARACQAAYDRMADELGFNVLFYRLGYAWVLYEQDEVTRMRDVVAMHHRIGLRSGFLGPDDALRILPVLQGGEPVAAAVVHDDAIVHHDAVVWAHLERIADLDVRLLPNTSVDGVDRDDTGVAGIRTDRGRIETRTVLNAAGAWSDALNELAGVRMPNRPIRREVLVTAPLEPVIDKAVTFYRPGEGWFNQTLRGEVVMGAVDPHEPYGHDQSSSWPFLRRTATLMVRKAPALAAATVIRQWAGMYDVTPDHLPIVGPTDQLGGWWLAHGWSGRGMLLAPHLVTLLAERIASGSRPAMLDAFGPDRFAGGEDDAERAPSDYYARYAGRG